MVLSVTLLGIYSLKVWLATQRVSDEERATGMDYLHGGILSLHPMVQTRSPRGGQSPARSPTSCIANALRGRAPPSAMREGTAAFMALLSEATPRVTRAAAAALRTAQSPEPGTLSGPECKQVLDHAVLDLQVRRSTRLFMREVQEQARLTVEHRARTLAKQEQEEKVAAAKAAAAAKEEKARQAAARVAAERAAQERAMKRAKTAQAEEDGTRAHAERLHKWGKAEAKTPQAGSSFMYSNQLESYIQPPSQ